MRSNPWCVCVFQKYYWAEIYCHMRCSLWEKERKKRVPHLFLLQPPVHLWDRVTQAQGQHTSGVRSKVETKGSLSQYVGCLNRFKLNKKNRCRLISRIVYDIIDCQPIIQCMLMSFIGTKAKIFLKCLWWLKMSFQSNQQKMWWKRQFHHQGRLCLNKCTQVTTRPSAVSSN